MHSAVGLIIANKCAIIWYFGIYQGFYSSAERFPYKTQGLLTGICGSNIDLCVSDGTMTIKNEVKLNEFKYYIFPNLQFCPYRMSKEQGI